MTDPVKFVLNNLQNRGWTVPEPAIFTDNALAYDAQDAAMAVMTGARGGIGGYKIAYNTPAQMQTLGQTEPGAAYICADQIAQDGVALAPADYENLMIEAEIAGILAEDLAPGRSYSAQDMAGLVARWVPAFELLDRRNTDAHFHVPTVLAHNIFNEGIVLGGSGAAVLPENLRSQVWDGDTVLLDAQNAAPQAPLDAAAFLANHFTGRGQTLKAGTVLMCGTHMPVYKPEPGHNFRFDLGALGSVSFSFG